MCRKPETSRVTKRPEEAKEGATTAPGSPADGMGRGKVDMGLDPIPPISIKSLQRVIITFSGMPKEVLPVLVYQFRWTLPKEVHMSKQQSTDERLIFLIEKATEIAGNKTKLARMLEIPGSHVWNWLDGTRTCTPEDRARLAGMCGLDANQELIRAIIEKHEGTKKGDDLRHFLGKSLLAIGAVVASSGASAAAIFSTTQGAWGLDALLMLLSTMYIMSNHIATQGDRLACLRGPHSSLSCTFSGTGPSCQSLGPWQHI